MFNIVLLDPLHNIQPSKDFSYKVDPCSPLPCVYTTLLEDVDRVKKTECIQPECPLHQALRAVPDKDHAYDVTILRMKEDVSQEASNLIADGHAKSWEEIVMVGVLTIQEQNQREALVTYTTVGEFFADGAKATPLSDIPISPKAPSDT